MAALSVVVIHTSFASGFTLRNALGIYTARMEIGVSVFFLISGFLLYRPYVNAHLRQGAAPHTRRFWARRLLRIVPAYWLAFTLITFVLHADRVVGGWWSWVVYYGFGQIYFPSRALTGVTQAWSLCTEVTFYLMLPAYAAIVRGRGRGRSDTRLHPASRELLGLGALVVISFAFRSWCLTRQGAGHAAIFSVMPDWLPANLDLFALGMLLAVVSCWLPRRPLEPVWLSHAAFPWVCWAGAALAFVAVSHLGIAREPLYRIPAVQNLVRQSLYGIFALLLLLPAVFGPQDRGAIRRLLQSPPFVAVGVVSYGVYLWHQSWGDLLFRWARWHLFSVSFTGLTVAVAALATASAALSYLMVERPILRFGHRRWGSTRSLGAASAPIVESPVAQAVAS